MPSTTASGFPYPVGSDELADTDLHIKALADFLQASANPVPTAWTAVTFSGGWSNNVAPYQTAQYRKIGDLVYLRGSIDGGTLGGVAFTLPVGFRPPADIIQAVDTGAGSTTYVEVQSDGEVRPAGGSNGFCTLDGITFSVTT
jgi:hypothetical protein